MRAVCSAGGRERGRRKEGKGESGWAPEEREGRREERGAALLKFKGISGVTVSSTCNDIS